MFSGSLTAGSADGRAVPRSKPLNPGSGRPHSRKSAPKGKYRLKETFSAATGCARDRVLPGFPRCSNGVPRGVGGGVPHQVWNPVGGCSGDTFGCPSGAHWVTFRNPGFRGDSDWGFFFSLGMIPYPPVGSTPGVGFAWRTPLPLVGHTFERGTGIRWTPRHKRGDFRTPMGTQRGTRGTCHVTSQGQPQVKPRARRGA